MSNRFDLVAAYRLYPKISKEPYVYFDDKFRLSRLCLNSFKLFLNKVNVKIYFILDTCPDEYEDLVKEIFTDFTYEIIKLSNAGNYETFLKQISILKDQSESELVYFAEDDYLYKPEECLKMITFASNNDDADFISPYNAPDYYNKSIHAYRFNIKLDNRCYWRTVSTTCLTFLTKRNVLKKTEDILRTYTKKNWDASIFSILTKSPIVNPLTILKNILHGKMFYAAIGLQAWFFGARYILFKSKFKIWVPIPSFASHMQFDGITEDFDWLNLIKQYEKNADIKTFQGKKESLEATMHYKVMHFYKYLKIRR